MSEGGNLIPISDEQAKALQEIAKAAQEGARSGKEALKALQGFAGFLHDTFGTVPEDVVALLGGNWLKVRRAEQLARMLEKARERLKARNVTPEPPSPSLLLPLLTAAADEGRDELQDIWARLLAAAADPARAKSFRLAFIEVAKKMDPLDAAVLQASQMLGGDSGVLTEGPRNHIAEQLSLSRDEVDVSIFNLGKLDLAGATVRAVMEVLPFGREFLRAVSD